MNLFVNIKSIIAKHSLTHSRFLDQGYQSYLNYIFIDLIVDIFLVKNH
jgi:hypothetical protein